MCPLRNKPKILFVLPATAIGGAETKTFNLLHYLHSFDRILATQSTISNFYSELEIKNYAFENFGCRNPSIFSINNILAYAKAIKRIVDYEKPDIVLGIMHTGALFVTIAHDIFFLKISSIVTIEGNISAYFNSIGRSPTLKERLLLKYCFERAKNIIVPSKGVRHDLINNFKVRGQKIKTIYNGIDIESLFKSSKEEIPFKKECPWIITACRLNNQKDFATLLKAFRIIREETKAKLLIIGDGELKEEITKLSIKLNVNGDVIMPGFQKNPFKYISRGDVFVLSSFYEGFGNVIVEAMAFGIPVVSTDCPSGPGEIINDGENGFLVPVKDFEKMAERCLSIITDTGLKKTISRNALKRAEDFSIYKMSKEYEDYIMGLIAK